jgi:hypothetical protein
VVTHGGTERLTDMLPRQVPSVLLCRPVGCSPCRQLRCPYQVDAGSDLPACLDLPPERVAAAALALAGAGRAAPDPTAPDPFREDPWWTTHALLSAPERVPAAS